MPRYPPSMYYSRYEHQPLTFVLSKRYMSLVLILSGLVGIFFYRTGQIIRFRVELNRARFLCRACEEKLKNVKGEDLENNALEKRNTTEAVNSSETQLLIRQMKGTKAATGFDDLKPLSSLGSLALPSLRAETHRLIPAYHMNSDRKMLDIVIGLPHVKRDKRNYLYDTLKDLVNGITEADDNSTLIIVMIAEVDLKYVLSTAWSIEKMFPEQVKSGLIQVLSPSASYYVNLDNLPSTLGDSPKRVKWRSKQVLDVLYLMAYGHTKGAYYLMMEDDVHANKNYMRHMKTFVSYCTTKEPEWMLIEFSDHFGSLGKLFRSSQVGHFLMYIQLFFYNMPLDFLIQSYVWEKSCDITRNSKDCHKAVLKVRKWYPDPLFKHIGVYSSLPGKIGKVEDASLVKGLKYFAHVNPPVKHIRCDVEELPFYSLKKAYLGEAMFIGVSPKSGDVIEFWFDKPTVLKRFKFQSGNFERLYDIFVNTDVEVCPAGSTNFSKVASFDELGYAGGDLEKFGHVECIRLRVIDFDWEVSKSVVLSEIELTPVVK